ncbi:MAG: RnfABCDGE type electron transport complex subunit G [Clostridia bacterium]|nr:RnfABCDGE type electron transport complex subunit G [Clostridia bacterium]
MKKINARDVLIPTVALLVICLVATALLAGTNLITSEKIALNAVETEKASRMLVLPEGAQYSEVTALDNGLTYCVGSDEGGNQVGYVFTSDAKGYGGTVSVMVGLDNEGTITGIEILSHSETPGLGANATKDDFKSRFIGKFGELSVDKTSNDGQNVQAITAATITSKAVTNAVNAVTAAFEELNSGGESNG